ncbi:MAG: polysaccharide pyruvyl transferase family protein, partial [Eubacterium sp.]|nr:polysaccharide pyruvyl transferase family protein [Eubacterium sp.]
LYTEDTEIDFISDINVIKSEISPEFINENYDYLVLPMANSFRETYCTILRKWSELIEKLTIPCVVTGIGVEMAYEPDINSKHPYDDMVKRFITAVLNHSHSIGVRGVITQAYLNHLGFRDIDVTGCPSIEMFGPGLKVRNPKPLTKESAVCVTGSLLSPLNFNKFMVKNFEKLPNYYFMPQFNDDLRLMYLGVPFHTVNEAQKLYPHDISSEVLVNDRARFFIDIPSILKFNKSIDFNYGTRIHGAVGCILCGVPSLLFTLDARTRELADYHNVPSMPVSVIDDDTDVFDIYEKTDFSIVSKGHEERFWHFVDFLNNNGLPHIYQDKNRKTVPFDERIKEIDFYGPVHSIYTCSKEEMLERMAIGQKMQSNEIGKILKACNDAKNQTKKINAQLDSCKKELEVCKKRLAWYDNNSAVHIAGSRIKKKLKSK